MNSNGSISIELGFALIAPGDIFVPVTASLRYRSDDPYAVHMSFDVGTDTPTEWIISRDLMVQSLTMPAGDGDIRMWPMTEAIVSTDDRLAAEECDILNIELRPPSGRAWLQAPAAEIARFLGGTYEVVAAGEEASAVDIEAELAALLEQA